MTSKDPATAVTTLLRARLRRLFRELPKALGGDEEAIHQMRVAGRRLRVALPMLARKPDGRRARRSLALLRRLVRTAGSSRDVDVGLTLLEQRIREEGAGCPERALLRRRLRSARGRSRHRMAEALLDLDIAQLRRHLAVVLRRRGEPLFTALLRLREARERRGEQVLGEIAELGQRFDPESLHRIRIGVRRLRYAAELLAALRDQPSEAAALLKQLQEPLGDVHDAHVLSLWFGRQAGAAEARAQAALAEEARRLELAFLQRSRDRHQAFLELLPTALLARALAAMGPTRSAA